MNRPPRWAAGRDGISHAHPSARATACGVPAIAECYAWPALRRCSACLAATLSLPSPIRERRLTVSRNEIAADLSPMATDATLALLRARKLEQACSECGRWEAAGAYCSGCDRQMGPDDWYPGGDRGRRQKALGGAQTPVKRPRQALAAPSRHSDPERVALRALSAR